MEASPEPEHDEAGEPDAPPAHAESEAHPDPAQEAVGESDGPHGTDVTDGTEPAAPGPGPAPSPASPPAPAAPVPAPEAADARPAPARPDHAGRPTLSLPIPGDVLSRAEAFRTSDEASGATWTWVRHLPGERAVSCHPPRAGTTVARVVGAVPPRAVAVRCRAVLDSERSLPVMFGLAIGLGAEALDGLGAEPGAAEGWSGWVTLAGGASAEIVLPCAPGPDAARDLLLLTRMETPGNNNFAWAKLRELTTDILLHGEPDPRDAAEADPAPEGEDALLTGAAREEARQLLRGLLADGGARPVDVMRLLRLEARAPGAMDPLDILDAGVRLHPRDPLLLIERAEHLAALGRNAGPDARLALEQPGPDEAMLLRATALLLAGGDVQRAAKALGPAVAAHPRSAPLLLRAAQAFVRAGAEEEAMRAAAALVALGTEPQAEQARLILARLHARRGHHAQALGLLMPLMAGTPAPPVAAEIVEITLRPVWATMPDYVDWNLVSRIERLIGLAGSALGDERLWEAVRLFTALDRPDAAHRLFAAAAARRGGAARDRPAGELAALIAEMFPFGSGAGIAPAPDDAALAQRLGWQGITLRATGRHLRAEICHRLARMLGPEDQAARFNAGFDAVAHGRIREAFEHFEGVVRVYDAEMARVSWPHPGRRPWPHARLDVHAAFDALRPGDREWPLITVITPSYNQARYIEETLLSVVNQGYPRLQYIVVDGLSDDGSADVIERYRPLVETVIIEKDGGQTEAINKGLRLARGEIVTWLNSDDQLAPGALHAVALNWMRTEADIIFGACLVHREHGFVLSNQPQVRADTFSLQHLGDLFRYWLKGFFFYQPETFFSRRILDKVGGALDETLYFTMDYEFWMRCAAAQASVEALDWPIALFRQHSEQKTSNLRDCVLEQAEVRDRFVRVAPSASRRLEVRARIERAFALPRPRVGIVSSRLGKIFSADAGRDLAEAFRERGLDVDLAESAAALRRPPDLLIKLIHLQHDVDEIEAFRKAGFAGPVVGWFWDNHHHLFANHEVATHLDVAVPGHHFARHYLRCREAVLLPSQPLTVTQWSRTEAARLWASLDPAAPRSDDLQGSFVRYIFARKRNLLIEGMIEAGFPKIAFLEEGLLEAYFGRAPEDRFQQWASHKASLALPLGGDLSQRVFDALLTGQVPVVPRDVLDLDHVIPPEMQRSLPVIRFDAYDLASVRAAHAEAIAAFDRGGPEAALARHRFALDGHMLDARVQALIDSVRGLGRSL